MPTIVGDSPLTDAQRNTSTPHPKNQQGIAQFMQAPADVTEEQPTALLTPISTKKSTPKLKKSTKKLTPKEKEDAEVLSRRNKKKGKSHAKSKEERQVRRLARQKRKEEELARKRGVQPIQTDGSNFATGDGDALMQAIIEPNPLEIPLPEDTDTDGLRENNESNQNATSPTVQTQQQAQVQMTEESTEQERETETLKEAEQTANNQSYSNAASAAMDVNDDDTAVQKNQTFQVRRVRLTLAIKTPEDKEQRLKLLQSKANDIMRIGRKHEPEFYLRAFDITDPTEEKSNKNKWHTRFKSSDCSMENFKTYFSGGLESYFPLNREKYYFRISMIAPHSCSMTRLINEIESVTPTGCKMVNILSQRIWQPTRLGSLLRSTEKLTSTGEFLAEVNRRAARIKPHVVFGMSCSELRHPNIPPAKDYRNANKAVQLECNEQHLHDATEVALILFPAKRPTSFKPVWGMNLVFMFDCSHPAVQNLDTAMVNIATLINRHKKHREYENRASNAWLMPGVLDDPVYEALPTTLRDVIMSIKSTTTKGCEGGTLFSSICYSDFRGRSEYWLTFHRKVKKEAEAVCRALPTMLRIEYNVTSEHFFLEGGIDPSEDWTVETRRLNNTITNATDMMLEGTEDLFYEEENKDGIDLPTVDEDENISLPTADEREMRRLQGTEDEETITDVKKKKTIKKPKKAAPIPITVNASQTDERSTGSSTVGMGSIAGHSKTRAAQQEVLEEANILIRENNVQLEAKLKKAEKKSKKMEKRNEKMARKVALMMKHFNIDDEESSDDESSGDAIDSQTSGQKSGEGEQVTNRFVPDLGTASSEEKIQDPNVDTNTSSDNRETDADDSRKNEEDKIPTEAEIDEKYPTDISEHSPRISSSSTDGEDTSEDDDSDKDDDDDSKSNENETEEEDSDASSNTDLSYDSENEDSPKVDLPLIPPHIKPTDLSTTFNNARSKSTGGDPRRPT